MNATDIKEDVKARYGKVAQREASGMGCCCGPTSPELMSAQIGYSEQEMKAVPDGANLGLGCGNPLGVASLQEGETVLPVQELELSNRGRPRLKKQETDGKEKPSVRN